MGESGNYISGGAGEVDMCVIGDAFTLVVPSLVTLVTQGGQPCAKMLATISMPSSNRYILSVSGRS